MFSRQITQKIQEPWASPGNLTGVERTEGCPPAQVPLDPLPLASEVQDQVKNSLPHIAASVNPASFRTQGLPLEGLSLN